MLKFALPLLMASNLPSGQEALKNQDYPAAIEYFQADIAQEVSYENLYGLARAQAFSGQYKAALDTYNRLLEMSPGNADVLFGRAQVQGWLNNYVAAEQDYLAVLEKAPQYSDAWAGLMRIYRWQEQPQLANAVFERWQKAQPDSYLPYLERAQLNFTQRRFTQAREDLSIAREKGATEAQTNPLLTRLNRLPGALPWQAMLNYEFQGFVEAQPPWHTVTGGIQYNFDRASIALQSISTQRFDQFDQGVIADSYFDLWSGAYANVRAQAVYDADILPQFDILGELYQTFAETWEVSGAYRLMSFPTNQVHFIQGSVGKYLGNWYFRAQPMLFLANDTTVEAGPGGNLTLWARHFYNTVDDFVELRSGVGRRIAVVGSGTTGAQLQGQTNAFALLSGQYFFNPRFGLTGALNYNFDQQFPDRFGGSVGTIYRW